MTIPTLQTARDNRDAGIEQSAETSGDEWVAYATDFLKRYLQSHATMHVDDLWDSGLRRPKSPRALGAVVRVAKRSGWMIHIEAYGGIVAKPSRSSNMQLKAVWRSLIFLH